MSHKNKNPRFSVRGSQINIKQDDSNNPNDCVQEKCAKRTLRMMVKWQLVRMGANGIISRSLATFLIKILGLKHE